MAKQVPVFAVSHEVTERKAIFSSYENIPIVNCPHCGESYLTAETMHEIERIKMHRINFAVERPVPVPVPVPVAKFA